jgi:hypothetical protein
MSLEWTTDCAGAGGRCFAVARALGGMSRRAGRHKISELGIDEYELGRYLQRRGGIVIRDPSPS